MMTKRLYLCITAMLFVLGITAQQQENNRMRFSPEQFDAELQQFITAEACLTQQEVAKFFPVYKEMQNKQRTLYERQRQLGKIKPADEQGCMKVVQERDNLEVELKRVQQTYHNKFFDLLPASKVYDVILAEDKFHRRKLKQWSNGPRPGGMKHGEMKHGGMKPGEAKSGGSRK